MMENKKVQLRFRAVNRDIFEAILDGTKKIETRAASPKFKDLQPGDEVVLVCGKEKVGRKIEKAIKFKTIANMVERYRIKDIHPASNTIEELEKVYYSFPGYKEKLEKYGLIALEFA